MAATSSMAVECANLNRVYTSRNVVGRRRDFTALKDLSLEIPRGAVFGLLGPNGAGKTTTVRILSTLLTPTSGSARVLGYDVVSQSRQVRRNTGFILGGERGLYGRITGEQNMRFFAALNHINPGEAKRRTEQLLDRVGLTEHARTPVENYSRGMKQRLHIARGLLTDPPLLFMDEPTIGIDPIGAQELRNYVPELASEGKTILLTTHYMA
ncbi:MAG: ABC transporter ATP-binding protein, partial [Chloroflexota bacterium]|nr:ABC transporter ATP-binding protein [Chloroflexota bacterium]